MPNRADQSNASRPAAYQRFIASMAMDVDTWRDGIGYDLDALRELTPDERESIRAMLKGRTDWRDAEALAALDPPGITELHETFASGRATLSARLTAGDELERLGQPVDFGPLVTAMLDAGAGGDRTALSRVMDWMEWRHPHNDERVKRHLLRLVLHTRCPVATNLAALACVVYGLSSSVNDWTDRAFWLRFAEPAEHDAAAADLLSRIGITERELHADS